MNVNKLKSLYRSNATVAVICDLFERDTKAHKVTTVDSLYPQLVRKDPSITRENVFDSLRGLQEVGLGELKFGRRGKKSRFIWAVPTPQIAEVAKGKSEFASGGEEEPAGGTEEETEEEPELELEEDEEVVPVTHKRPPQPAITRQGSVTSIPTMNAFSVSLRKDVTVSFWLPIDFTKEEALKLVTFLCTIPATTNHAK